MRSNIVKQIFFKEMRDIFRDKKTVFMMIVLPILLYPVLMIGFSQIMLLSSASMEKKELSIAFDFKIESNLQAIIDENNKEEKGKLKIVEKKDLEKALEDREIAAYVKKEGEEKTPTYKIYINSSIDDSNMAGVRLKDIFNQYKERIIKEKIEAQGLVAKSILEPIQFESVNTAKDEEMAGYLLGQILPIILIIGILLGAIYPAIDIMAGEKERGTLETLLTLPVSNLELILGKYLAVALVSIVSALLNILSIALCLVFVFLQASAQMEEKLGLKINLSQMGLPFIITLICILLFALVITAVIMCVCSLAKSFKEAQNYSTPIMFVFMIPAYACMVPNIELNNATALIPVVNVALLIKSVLLFKYDLAAMTMVLLSSAAFAILSLIVLTKMFHSEEILFGDGKGFSFLEKRENIKKHTMPGVSDAVILYAVAILLFVYVGSYFQLKWGMLGVGLTQVIFLALPILLGVYIKTDFKKLFCIRKPKLKGILGSIILWAGMFMISLLISQFTMYLFPQSEETANQLNKFLFDEKSLWINLFIVALLPSICEEVLFRGFIFNALRKNNNRKWALIVSALMFGVMHLYFIKIIPTALLGLVLAYILYKTESIFAPMLIHFLNNGLGVLMSHYPHSMYTKVFNRINIDFKHFDIGNLCLVVGISAVLIGIGIFILKNNTKVIEE